MKKIKGEVAFVAGGSGGMGTEIVKKFLIEGAKVVSADINNPSKKINDDNVTYCKLDATDPTSWGKAIKHSLKKFKKISILVNCFGSNYRKDFKDQTIDEWNKILNINLTAVFIGINSVIPIIEKENGGSVINFGSIVTMRPGSTGPAYQASKTGLIGLTKSAALSFAKKNIRFNLICPGHVDTDFIRADNSYSPNDWSTSINNPKNYNSRKKQIPLKNFQNPEDIANLVLFLASSDSKMITGAVIPVDGGSSL